MSHQYTKRSLYQLAGTKYTGMTARRGEKDDYLGIDLDYSTGVVTVSMAKHTRSIIDNFPKLIITPSATLASDNLLKVRDVKEATLLPEDQAAIFHHTFAQLLFLSTRARHISD